MIFTYTLQRGDILQSRESPEDVRMLTGWPGDRMQAEESGRRTAE